MSNTISNLPPDVPLSEKKSYTKPLLIGFAILIALSTSIFFLSRKPVKTPSTAAAETPSMPTNKAAPSDTFCTFIVPHDVKIKDYFTFIDSVVSRFDTTILPYKLTEYLLVRSNPFIIDTLENTDYDRMKLRDSFVYDQKQAIVLKKGDILNIPNLAAADTLKAKLSRTRLDVNIPEFKLRIIEDADTVYTFPIRVGQNRKRYLSEVGRDIDLKTRTGKGFIAFNYKKDYFVDPVEGKKFTVTKRDDGRKTLMPLEPWLEPKMEGQLWGQLIHPTTNPESMGKAYSNGCMGTREGDIWRIYYYAPVGTKVTVRYDLTPQSGDSVRLKDIYSPKYRKIG